MVELRIGKHGVVLLLILFLLLGVEDILVWMRAGTLPGVEFFVATAIVVAVFAFAIYEAVSHPPPHH